MEKSLFDFSDLEEELKSGRTAFLQEEINKIRREKLLEFLMSIEISNKPVRNQNNFTGFASSLEITQPSASSKNFDSEENDCSATKEFIWPNDAVYLLLELYQEEESNFTLRSKRITTVWAELAEKMKEKSNGEYSVTELQCFVKMSDLIITFKNIKDQSKKNGNWNTWPFYSMMELIFDKKAFKIYKAYKPNDRQAINKARDARMCLPWKRTSLRINREKSASMRRQRRALTREEFENELRACLRDPFW